MIILADGIIKFLARCQDYFDNMMKLSDRDEVLRALKGMMLKEGKDWSNFEFCTLLPSRYSALVLTVCSGANYGA